MARAKQGGSRRRSGKVDALVNWVTELVRRQSWRRGLLLGMPLFLLALGLRMAMGDMLAGRPFVFFVPVVLATVLVGGGGPGIFVALLSALTGWYYFVIPYRSFAAPPLQDGLAMLFAWGGMLVTVLLVAALSRSMRLLDQAEAAARNEAEGRRTMFHELQHRVANNLQFVSALLGLAAGQVHCAEDGRAALWDAQRRLQQMARLHRWLHDPDTGRRDLAALLGAICEQLRDATGDGGASFELEIAPVTLAAESLTAVALIVNEAVTNALKHGGTPAGALRVRVVLQSAENLLDLSVRDNGPGLPEGLAGKRRGSLGLRVMEALAGQLGGRLELANDAGAVVRVRFPAHGKPGPAL